MPDVTAGPGRPSGAVRCRHPPAAIPQQRSPSSDPPAEIPRRHPAGYAPATCHRAVSDAVTPVGGRTDGGTGRVQHGSTPPSSSQPERQQPERAGTREAPSSTGEPRVPAGESCAPRQSGRIGVAVTTATPPMFGTGSGICRGRSRPVAHRYLRRSRIGGLPQPAPRPAGTPVTRCTPFGNPRLIIRSIEAQPGGWAFARRVLRLISAQSVLTASSGIWPPSCTARTCRADSE